MGLGIATLIGGTVFTMSYAGSHVTTGQSSQGQTQMNRQSGSQPPSMPSGGGSQQGGTPPTKPNGNSSGNSTDGSDVSSSSAGDSESSANESAGDGGNGASSQAGQPPEMPSGQKSQSQSDQGQPEAESSSGKLDAKYYMIFAILGLGISFLALLMIMTRGNKYTAKEVFANRDKVIIAVLAGIIMTTVLTAADGAITNKFFVKENGNAKAGGQSSQNVSYSGATIIDSDTTEDGKTYSSSKADQNALLVTGDITATIKNATITKTGDSDGGDNTSFYGMNSAVLAKGGAKLNISGATITTDAAGANGVFSYGGSATTQNASGDGTTVTISDSKITTKKDNSGGIMTTGGGVMKASNLTVDTAGTSSAAIRSDRGGGAVTADGGTYTTTGKGSPAIYSTANITAKNAKLISKASEGVVIEGKNSVSLENVELTGTNSQLNGQSTTYKNIFLYQSMSGDADTGEASFSAKGSKITTNKGDTLYVTNTTAKITLENNTITNNDTSGNFLRIQKDSWGKEGSNGGNVTLQMKNQAATGNIVVDGISTLDMTMSGGSSYTDTINGDNSAKSIKLALSADSQITLTGDSYVSSLDDADSSYSNINLNGHKLYVNGVAIN